MKGVLARVPCHFTTLSYPFPPLSPRRGNLDAIGSQLSGSYSLWGDWSEDERLYHIMGILKVLCVHERIQNTRIVHQSCLLLPVQELGLRGVLDLLGIRKTAGSSDLLPPSKEVLLTTFNAPHRCSTAKSQICSISCNQPFVFPLPPHILARPLR